MSIFETIEVGDYIMLPVLGGKYDGIRKVIRKDSSSIRVVMPYIDDTPYLQLFDFQCDIHISRVIPKKLFDRLPSSIPDKMKLDIFLAYVPPR